MLKSDLSIVKGGISRPGRVESREREEKPVALDFWVAKWVSTFCPPYVKGMVN